MDTLNIITGEVEKRPWYDSTHQPIEDVGEIMDQRSQTEQSYIPPTHQIQDMMKAGVRLAEERRARFDSIQLSAQEEDDLPLDPTREPGVDIVDIQRTAAKVQANLAAAYDLAKKAEEAAKATPPAPQTPTVTPK